MFHFSSAGRVLCGALLAVFLLPGFALSASSPSDTIRAVQQAIDNKDTDAFTAHVDLDHLLKQVVSTFLDSSAADTSDKAAQTVELPPAVAGMARMARDPAMRGQLQMLLIGEARSFVLYGVGSGHFAGKPDDTVSASGLLAPFLPQLAPGRKTVTAAGSARRDGATYLMPVTVYDAGSKETTRLSVRFTEQDSIWKVSEIANLPALLEALPRK